MSLKNFVKIEQHVVLQLKLFIAHSNIEIVKRAQINIFREFFCKEKKRDKEV
ncbi:MAG: hypothetical protein K0R24_1247 [Gammaproteobacteria bacterium]|jgi:hypothetical protein|nr:hypothetical protein [Gammaproteobacteria bacterium]